MICLWLEHGLRAAFVFVCVLIGLLILCVLVLWLLLWCCSRLESETPLAQHHSVPVLTSLISLCSLMVVIVAVVPSGVGSVQLCVAWYCWQ